MRTTCRQLHVDAAFRPSRQRHRQAKSATVGCEQGPSLLSPCLLPIARPRTGAAIQRSRDTGGNRPLCRVLDYAELATARWQFGSARYCGRHRVTLHNFGTRRGRPRKRYRRSQAIVGCAASGCLWVTRLATNQAPGHAPLATRESSTADDGKIMWSTVAIFVAVSRAIRRLSQRTIHNRKLCIMAVMQSYA